MAVGDIYQAIDVQELFGQQVLNVYHYKMLTAPSTGLAVNALYRAMDSIINGVLVLLQSSQLKHTGWAMTNLDDDSEFALIPTNYFASGPADAMPPFVAYSFRYNRDSRAVRNGQKRYAGVCESFVDSGVLTSVPLVNADALAVLLQGPLTDVLTGAIFQPRILHRATTAGVGGATSTTPRADYGVASVQYVRVSSQNTRKFGHGA